MAKRMRRNNSSECNAKGAMAALVGDKTLAELAQLFDEAYFEMFPTVELAL